MANYEKVLGLNLLEREQFQGGFCGDLMSVPSTYQVMQFERSEIPSLVALSEA